MSNLIKLKDITLDLILSISAREELTQLANYVLLTQTKPLIEFSNTHDVFFEQMSSSGDLFDKWLSLQLQFLTELGDLRISVREEFANFFLSIIESNGVLDVLGLKTVDLKDPSVFTLLALRIYGPLLELEEVK